MRNFIWKKFFKFIYIVCKDNIHIIFIENSNQSKVTLISKANNAISEIKKAWQVFIYKKDEKYVFIAILLGFYKDEVLIIQNIWKKAIIRILILKTLFKKFLQLAINLHLIKILIEVHLPLLKHWLYKFSCHIRIK